MKNESLHSTSCAGDAAAINFSNGKRSQTRFWHLYFLLVLMPSEIAEARRLIFAPAPGEPPCPSGALSEAIRDGG
jgi:hypothetical protein